MTRLRWLIPMALTVSALVIFLGGEALHKLDRPAGRIDSAEIEGEVTTAPSPGPIYDDQGRRVFDMGKIRLHIPVAANPTSTVASPPENRMVRLILCWPRDEKTGECPGIASVIVIFLHGRADPATTIDDSMADLQRRLPSSDGPYETEFEGVWEFRYPPSGDVFNYALREPDAIGRHAIARCYGPRCTASITVHSYLVAQYTFDRGHIEIWPQVDHQVRQYVTSFIVEE